MSETIRIALADDHDLFREGIQSIIQKMDNIELILQAASGLELLSELKNIEVDLILMDLQMKDMDGIEATKKVMELYPDVKIIILTMHNEERMITYMMETGANGYLLKSTKKDELELAIRNTYLNGFYFNDQVSQALLSGLKRRNPSKPTFNLAKTLSSREAEVLELICQELTTQEIADKLFISHRTVEGHRKKLIEKFHVKNTTGLVIKAFKEGLIH
ncbi:MAG: response regulator transcription factor [Cyclobacteriaceae bacterium]